MEKAKSILSLFLSLAVLFLFCGSAVSCKGKTEDQPKIPTEEETVMNALDGKKIIFLGDSMIYYGQTVMEKSQSNLTLDSRDNDNGYFYQLCRTYGAKVNVVNWTFGGHPLLSYFSDKECGLDYSCGAGNHFSYLKEDNRYDYVCFSVNAGEATRGDYLKSIPLMMKFFQEGNPNVKFYATVSTIQYGMGSNNNGHNAYLNYLKDLEKEGVTIVDFGGFVHGVVTGEVKLEGSSFDYNRYSFIISKSEKDGHHPNQLTGYITAMMVFSAITGLKTQGMSRSFLNKSSISTKFSYSNYKSSYYTWHADEERATNYDKILSSDAEVLVLQKAIDAYMEAKSYRNYNIKENADMGSKPLSELS